MKKLLVRAVLAILVLLVLAVGVVWVTIDPITKTAVEKGAGYALQVETRLDKVNVSLLDGKLVMEGLNISNPEGFDSPHLMRFERFDLAVRPGSLFADALEIEKFVLDGLDVNVEQRLVGSNVSKIIDNLKRFSTDEEKKEGRKVKVNRIVIRNVVAHFRLLPELSSGGPITIEIPEIELESVTSDNAGGVVVSQLVTRLVPAILAAIIENGEGVVPGDFLNDLDGQVAGLGRTLGEQADKAIENVLENILGGQEESGKDKELNE